MMFIKDQKFNKEIASLPEISQPARLLSVQEVARIKRRIFQSILAEQAELISVPEIEIFSWRKILVYATSAAAGFSLLAGTAFASGSSIPGDLLYPIKRATEKFELAVTVGEQPKAELQAKFARERLVEFKKLESQSRHLPQIEAPVVIPQAPVSNASDTSSTGNPFKQQANDSIDNNGSAKQVRLRSEARQEASQAVDEAISALQKVQLNLEDQGDNQAAVRIKNNIVNLQQQAKQVDGLPNGQSDNNSRGEEEKNTADTGLERGDVREQKKEKPKRSFREFNLNNFGDGQLDNVRSGQSNDDRDGDNR